MPCLKKSLPRRGASRLTGPSSALPRQDDGITHEVTKFLTLRRLHFHKGFFPSSLQRSMLEVPCSMFTPPATLPTPDEEEEMNRDLNGVK
jgi:hypothetical protein